jgi:DNA-binding MarR family transcriptional regulator
VKSKLPDIASVNDATLEKFERKRMQHMSTNTQQQIEWRRAKVIELLRKGENNQSEIARILQVDKSIICRDIASQTTN